MPIKRTRRLNFDGFEYCRRLHGTPTRHKQTPDPFPSFSKQNQATRRPDDQVTSRDSLTFLNCLYMAEVTTSSGCTRPLSRHAIRLPSVTTPMILLSSDTFPRARDRMPTNTSARRETRGRTPKTSPERRPQLGRKSPEYPTKKEYLPRVYLPRSVPNRLHPIA